MADLTSVRVKALIPARRRAGFAFTPEAVVLKREDFAVDNLAAMAQFLAIVADPHLSAVIIDEDGGEKSLTAEDVAELAARFTALRDAETEFEPASGAGSETGGGAPALVDPAASSGEANASATPANSPGNGTSSTDGPGHSREQADALGGGSTAGADEGKQPEATAQPPVVEADTGPSVAPVAEKPAGTTKPKKGTTRAD